MTTLNPDHKSYNYYEALFNLTRHNSVLLISPDGIIKQINASFSEIFGYTESDLVGVHFNILFTKEDQEKGRPANELEKALRAGQANDNNYLVHKNKSISWVSGESIRIEDPHGNMALLKVIQDIHVQKDSENLLLNLNGFLERILSSIDDIVIVLNNDLEILKINKAYADVFGPGDSKSSTSSLHIIINELSQKHDLKGLMSGVQLSGNTRVIKEVALTSMTSEKKMYDISLRVIESINSQQHFLIILHDKTLEYQTEKQREDIIGFVAHELRNPLANIVLANDLLRGILENNKMTVPLNFLQKSQNNVSRLTKMIGELYEATKVSSGVMNLEAERFHFEEMIREAVETTTVLQPDYKIIIEGSADLYLVGDKFKIIQVVTNFLSNGIKYSLGAKDVKISLTVSNDNNVIVAVIDRGLGISKDQIPLVFNRFFRAEKTRNFEGIGLGLYLSKLIIEAHKGEVWVESTEGKGSTFYFSLPITPELINSSSPKALA